MQLIYVLRCGALILACAASALAQAPPAGPQPYEPRVTGYNGSLAPQMYPGGSQQARLIADVSIRQVF